MAMLVVESINFLSHFRPQGVDGLWIKRPLTGADLRSKNNENVSTLLLAFSSGHQEIGCALLAAGSLRESSRSKRCKHRRSYP